MCRAGLDRLLNRRKPCAEIDAALTVIVLSAEFGVQGRIDELGGLGSDSGRRQGLQREFGSHDVVAAVPTNIDDEAGVRQRFDQPHELRDKGIRIVHVEGIDP